MTTNKNGQVEILHGIALNVGAGEIVEILGRNGADKTALLKTIMGVCVPAEAR